MKKIVLSLVFLFASYLSFAQVGIGTTTPDASAILELSSASKGFLMPRMADTLSITNPAAGLQIYNTTSNTIWFYDGTKWLESGAGSGSSTSVVISAEYAGAVMMGDGTNNTGFMTSDNTGSGNGWMNYYEWGSLEASQQDYDVIVRIHLPEDFKAWDNNAIVIDYLTSTANSQLDIDIRQEDDTQIDFLSSLNSSNTWSTATFTAAEVVNWTAGETVVIILKMSTFGVGNKVQIGDITLNYTK